MRPTPMLLLFVAAPLMAVGQERAFHFDNETITHPEGKAAQSQNFIFTLTGDGDTDNHQWEIKEDSGAPSPRNVLAITKAEAVDTCWPIAFLKGAERYQDSTVSVRFKIVGGTVNQAAGVIVRARDADHSYLIRASALDNSVVLLRVNKKDRARVANARANVSANRWHTLRVVMKGAEFECYLNDTKVFTAKDTTYPLGKVGMISQADSSTYFDDFTVTPAGVP
jgi:hypothetical protein